MNKIKSKKNKKNKINFIYKRLISSIWIFIKNNPWNILTTFLAIITLFYVIRSYKSPADVHCSFDMIQRSDSVFQAQIYIWNSGDETANNISFHANKKNVFAADTSKKKSLKLSLLVYPVLSVYSTLTPSRILNHLGKEVKFNNYKFNIPQLHSAEIEDNYFIVMINSKDQKKFRSRKNSIYFNKFCQLIDSDFYKPFISEILDNIKIYFGGKILDPEIRYVYKISERDGSEYFFPTLKEVGDYPKRATAPDYLLPPLNILKVIKDKNEESSSGFKKFKGFRGFKGW